MSQAELYSRVLEWIDGDPEAADRAELFAMLANAQIGIQPLEQELADRFAGHLQFGTAGLRGEMAAGPNRMNRAVVIRAAAGVMAYLFQQLEFDPAASRHSAPRFARQHLPWLRESTQASSPLSPRWCARSEAELQNPSLTPAEVRPPAESPLGSGNQAGTAPDQAGTTRPPRVVIGNDARHHSRQFAIDTAAVVVAAGGEALLLPDPVPTPLLAYAVRHLGADAGVMVTASHNPAQDNGYKVYLGGRMVPDHAAGVQIVPPHDSAIAAQIAAQPAANQVARAESGWQDVGAELAQNYLEAIAAGDPPAAQIRIVHTAMHGVGSPIALAALAKAGFDDVHPVAAQRLPDPDFPTVAFPNPEEAGAIDLALELAQAVGADVVIANDPDADRCAVAIPDPRSGWRMLHGDEAGAILGDYIGRQLAGDSAPVLANSIVSSRLLGKIAAHYGLAHQTCLTGFKWLARVEGLAYAYEEAIGYCLRPDLVRDKDGLSTAVALARLVARLKAEGSSVVELLDDLARRHGLYLTSQLSVRFDDLSQIPATMAQLRAHPPARVAGATVSQLADLSQGYEGLPPTDGILILTEQNDRVIVRPSGTEPKVKCYLEVVQPVDAEASFDQLTELRTAAARRLDEIKADLQRTLFA